MHKLTTTQHSALGDLRRFGRLHPPGPRQVCERGTTQGFSQRTLQALVDAGYAAWAPRRDGTWPSIVPVEDSPESRGCEECGAVPGEECDPFCTGLAAHLEDSANGSRVPAVRGGARTGSPGGVSGPPARVRGSPDARRRPRFATVSGHQPRDQPGGDIGDSTMSGYASKAEYVDVLRQTIATDHNGLGYPRDPARFNIAGILRDSNFGGDRYYGYRPDYSCDLPEILRANYRPAHRANRRERPTSYVGRRRLEAALVSA